MKMLQNSCIVLAQELYGSFNQPMVPSGHEIIHVVLQVGLH